MLINITSCDLSLSSTNIVFHMDWPLPHRHKQHSVHIFLLVSPLSFILDILLKQTSAKKGELGKQTELACYIGENCMLTDLKYSNPNTGSSWIHQILFCDLVLHLPRIKSPQRLSIAMERWFRLPRVVPRRAASVSHGNLLEMQTPRPDPRPLESETMGWGLEICIFASPLGVAG